MYHTIIYEVLLDITKRTLHKIGTLRKIKSHQSILNIFLYHYKNICSISAILNRTRYTYGGYFEKPSYTHVCIC